MLMGWLTVPRAVDAVRPQDYDTLEEIHAASFAIPWSADEQAALAEQPGVTTLVARRGSATASRRPVGFITVRRAGDEAEVLTMAVAPRHRRSGIGRMLIDAALRGLYADRVSEVFLEVDPSNNAAVGLYRSIGFEPVGERPQYYRATGEKALTMRLRVDQPASLVRR